MEDFIQTITKKPLIAIGIVVAIVLLIAAITLFSGGRNISNLTDDNADIVVKKDADTLLINNSGYVKLVRNGREFEAFWDDEKMSLFKLYLTENLLEQDLSITGYSITIDGVTYYLSGDDELIQVIISETQAGDDDNSADENNDEGDDEGLDDYFNPSTPRPTSSSGGGGASGGGGSGPSWCKLWRLSYCADPLPRPSPSPSIVPTPSASAVPYVFDCGLGGEMVTDRTVISNTLCVKTPTPTPS